MFIINYDENKKGMKIQGKDIVATDLCASLYYSCKIFKEVTDNENAEKELVMEDIVTSVSDELLGDAETALEGLKYELGFRDLIKPGKSPKQEIEIDDSEDKEEVDVDDLF